MFLRLLWLSIVDQIKKKYFSPSLSPSLRQCTSHNHGRCLCPALRLLHNCRDPFLALRHTPFVSSLGHFHTSQKTENITKQCVYDQIWRWDSFVFQWHDWKKARWREKRLQQRDRWLRSCRHSGKCARLQISLLQSPIHGWSKILVQVLCPIAGFQRNLGIRMAPSNYYHLGY